MELERDLADAIRQVENQSFAVGGVLPERIGICEDHGWWFPVGYGVTDATARCPDPKCTAEVMVVERSPQFAPPQEVRRVQRNADRIPPHLLYHPPTDKPGLFQWDERQIADLLSTKKFDVEAIINGPA